jgi:hypothetical protein
MNGQPPPLEKAYWISQVMLVAVLGIGGILVAIFTLIDLNENVVETRIQAAAVAAQAKTAQQEFELSQRPWVSISEIAIESLGFAYQVGDGSITVSATLSNSGHSVARDSRFRVLFITDVGKTNYRTEEKDLCAQVEAPHEAEGIAIFPDETVSESSSTVMGREEIKKSRKMRTALNPENKHATPLLLVACIDYKSTVSDENFHTHYAFLVSYQARVFNIGGLGTANESQNDHDKESHKDDLILMDVTAD